jgi:hypothetical protein
MATAREGAQWVPRLYLDILFLFDVQSYNIDTLLLLFRGFYCFVWYVFLIVYRM